MTQYTNNHNLPGPIFHAISNPDYDPAESDITVTQVIDSPRVVALEKRFGEDIPVDIVDEFPAWIGSVIHNALEKAEKIHPVEKRLYVERGGWKIGGQFDRLFISLDENGELTGEIQDWKCILAAAVRFSKWSWEAQLNLLAWILRENGYTITSLKVHAILIDWRKKNIGRVSDYPESPVVDFEIPLWSLSQCEEYVAGRMALHQEARSLEEPDLDPCTPEERWAREDAYAVMKEGRKTAMRVFSHEILAKDWIEEQVGLEKIKEKDLAKISIEHRPGESIRCKDYCKVAGICSQWEELNNEKEPDDAP